MFGSWCLDRGVWFDVKFCFIFYFLPFSFSFLSFRVSIYRHGDERRESLQGDVKQSRVLPFWTTFYYISVFHISCFTLHNENHFAAIEQYHLLPSPTKSNQTNLLLRNVHM